MCRIAETFGSANGLGEFEIERVVHSKSNDKDEWIIHLKFVELDPLIEDDGQGAIVVVDSESEKARLIEGL